MLLLFVASHYQAELFLCSRHRNIQHIGVISKLGNLIVYHAHNDSVILASLVFMNGPCFNFVQLIVESIHLIIIWCYNSYAVEIFQFRQHFFLHHIYLTLIIVVYGMITLHRPYSTQHVILALILCHNEQVSSIEFLITEINNTRMTTIMLPKQSFRNTHDHIQNRLQETVLCAIISLGDIVLLHDNIEFFPIFICHHIWKLQSVSYNNSIPCTRQSQRTCINRHLRSLIHNNIVIRLIRENAGASRERSAKNNRILLHKFLTIPSQLIDGSKI